MKVFVIFEDDPQAPGGVSVNVMPQLTVNDMVAGAQPFDTLAGQCALVAKDHIDAIRSRAELAATFIKQIGTAEQAQCLH